MPAGAREAAIAGEQPVVTEEQAEYEVFFDEDEPPEDDPEDMRRQPAANGTQEPAAATDRNINITPLGPTDLVKGIPSGGGTWGVKNATVPSSKGMLHDVGNNVLKVRPDFT